MIRILKFGLLVVWSLAMGIDCLVVGNDTDDSGMVEPHHEHRIPDKDAKKEPSRVNIRVGLIAPKHLKLLNNKIGYATSAGAISLAYERVVSEQLLPTVDWSFTVGDSACNEAKATGLVIEWLSKKEVDVLFGPACGLTAQAAATICKYYNIPMYSWAATGIAFEDEVRYPSTIKVISTALRAGRAMREFLAYFKWMQFAFMYTDDKLTRNCYTIAEGLRREIAKSPIINIYNLIIDRPTVTDEDIERFLNSMNNVARVSIVCLDHEEDMRRFMIRAQEKGLTGDEYVYILPDFVRDQNRSELWLQYDRRDGHIGEGKDTRDDEAKKAFKSAFFFEMLLTNNEELHYFKKEIIERVKGWPFYHNAGDTALTEKYGGALQGSLYSPFLHDAMYLYSLALNKTLRHHHDHRNGSKIMDASGGISFLGASGHVLMDKMAGRVPNFVIKQMDKTSKMIPIIEMVMSKKDGETINLLVPERMIWQSRGFVVPTAVPRCGFNNERCSTKENSHLLVIVLVAVVSGLLVCSLILIIIISYIRRFLLSNEMAKMLWKITYRELDFVNRSNSRSSSREGSMHTITTQTSDETAEARAKGVKQVAHWRGILIWAKEHQSSMVFSSDEDHQVMKTMRDIVHDNLNTFFGLALDGPHPTSVWRYQSKGSLEDVLHNDNVKLDWFFKYALIRDLGMEFLHGTDIKTHGRLRSTNCVLDARFTVKVTDFGLPRMRVPIKEAKDKLWTAPEFLRMMEPPLEGTQAGDVYSLAIVIQEILCRGGPYCNDNLSPGDIVLRVAKSENPPFRPTINISDPAEADPEIFDVLNDCWKEKAEFRPSMSNVKSLIRKMYKGKKVNLMDHILRMMEKYTQSLETTVNERTKQMTDEVKRADMLLYKMIPKDIAAKLKSGQSVDPTEFTRVTVLSCTAPQFHSIAERSTPLQCILMINDLFTMLDEIIADLDVYKIETININAYVCASGLPTPNGDEHGNIMCDVALLFISSVKNYHILHLPSESLTLQIGIATDRLTAGVVGSAMPRYCTFGDCINVSHILMESGRDSCIQLTEMTYEILKKTGSKYLTKPRGEYTIPGRGKVFTYWLLGKSNNLIHDATATTASDATSDASQSQTSLNKNSTSSTDGQA